MIDRNESDAATDLSTQHVLERLARSGDETETLIDAFAHRRRRLVLAVLDARPESVEFEALVDVVAVREGDETGVVDVGDRERVRISLYHWHLPKLADAGLVEYDRESGRVRRAS